MKRSKFTESQIFAMLKSYEKGQKVGDICREHGISTATFYAWKSKYGGVEASEMKRLRDLEKELAQYKKIVAEQALSITVLKDVIEKKR